MKKVADHIFNILINTYKFNLTVIYTKAKPKEVRCKHIYIKRHLDTLISEIMHT